jgi:serine/threonine-protein kinase RsbW
MSDLKERVLVSLPATHALGVACGDLLRGLCTELEASHDLPDSFGFQVISAFQEAYNNVIIHAYDGQEGHLLEVSFATDAISLQVSLTDEGKELAKREGVNALLDFSSFETEDMPEGGMGLSLMHACMDLVTHERIDGKNRLVMRKFFGMLSG